MYSYTGILARNFCFRRLLYFYSMVAIYYANKYTVDNNDSIMKYSTASLLYLIIILCCANLYYYRGTCCVISQFQPDRQVCHVIKNCHILFLYFYKTLSASPNKNSYRSGMSLHSIRDQLHERIGMIILFCGCNNIVKLNQCLSQNINCQPNIIPKKIMIFIITIFNLLPYTH